MKKSNMFCIVLALFAINYSFSQETTSWKSFPVEYENQVRQNLKATSEAWSTKNFDAARSEYNKVVAILNAPAQYKSYAQLRIAQSYMSEKNTAAARTEYENIRANKTYPEVHRYEAKECIKEIDRMAKGLPARDVMESRTIIKPVKDFTAEFYIAPNGKDSNLGTAKRPFATLEKARDEIRTLKTKGLTGPFAVNLLPGKYQANEPFVLTSDDSGTPSAPIVYRADNKGTAVLYGGKKLSGFKLVTDPTVLNCLPEKARGKVYQCDLKKLGVKDYGELVERGYGVNPPPTLELFFNNQPLTVARWPNNGFVIGGKVIEPGVRSEKKSSVSRGSFLFYSLM